MVKRPFEDAAAVKAVRDARQKERNVGADIDDFIEAAFTTVQGRRFFWWLLEIGKVGMQPFSGNALTTSFGCGELNVGNQILARILEVTPEGYINLLKEHNNARRSDPEPGANADSDT